jgi:hypothetical protein
MTKRSIKSFAAGVVANVTPRKRAGALALKMVKPKGKPFRAMAMGLRLEAAFNCRGYTDAKGQTRRQ